MKIVRKVLSVAAVAALLSTPVFANKLAPSVVEAAKGVMESSSVKNFLIENKILSKELIKSGDSAAITKALEGVEFPSEQYRDDFADLVKAESNSKVIDSSAAPRNSRDSVKAANQAGVEVAAANNYLKNAKIIAREAGFDPAGAKGPECVKHWSAEAAGNYVNVLDRGAEAGVDFINANKALKVDSQPQYKKGIIQSVKNGFVDALETVVGAKNGLERFKKLCESCGTFGAATCAI